VCDVFGAPRKRKGKGKGKGEGLGGGTIEPRKCLGPSMNSQKPPYFGADSEIKKKGTKLSDVTGEDTAEEAAAEEEEPSEEEILSWLRNDCEESDRIYRDRIDREVLNYGVFGVSLLFLFSYFYNYFLA
jgi:hypothetical protein